MTVEIDVAHRLGPNFAIEARFVSDGPLIALFGRSGAGKTTIVNIIAGLIRPERGRIVVNGDVLVDTQRRIFVPKHRRRIGYVFQEGRLFPHLTVRQNLLYGRWFTCGTERFGRLDDVVDLLGIAALLDRRPDALSGGEKQRVALGRALLASPRVLLMDEPFAALDEARKAEILPYVERLRDEIGIPIVYVSHAVAEVTRLATTMVLMSDGKVEAVGTVADLMGRLDLYPMTGRFEAGAVLDARVAGADPAFGLTILQARAGTLSVPQLDLPTGTPVRVRIRARDVMLAIKRPEGVSALNILAGRLVAVGRTEGPVADLRLDLNGDALLARVTRRTIHDLALVPGRAVYAVIKSVALDRHSLGQAGAAHDGDHDGGPGA